MPTVPRLSRQVSPTALPGARLTAQETALSGGVGVHEAKARYELAKGGASADVWNAAAGFGQQVTRASSAVAEIVIQEQRRADDVALMEKQNQLSTWTNKRLYDPQNGALARQGKDALGAPEEVGAEFDKLAGEIEGTLGNPRQRAAFMRIRDNAKANLDLTLRRHVFGEMQKYEASELKALVDNSVSSAIQNATDPARVGFELTNAVDAIERSGPRLGLGPEQVKAQVEAVQTKTHVGVVESLVSQGHTKAATAYFEEAKDAGQISGDAVARVEKALREGTVRKEAQEQADKIILAGGTLTEQRDRAKAIEDPDVRDRALTYIEHEATIKERAQREQSENLLRGVYAVVEESGGDISAVEPALWAQLDAKDLAGVRAYARTVAKGEPVETDLETYYGLMRRAVSTDKGFLNENLLRYRNKLSEGDFQQLANLQRSLREQSIDAAATAAKNQAKIIVDEFSSKSQVFDDRLRAYGIDPNPKEGTPEAKAIANLRGVLDRRVRALGGGETGKTATNDEIREILDAELSTQITTTRKGTWAGLFTAAPFFTTTEKKRPIELTLDDMTDRERQSIEQALRRNRIPVNDATVLEAFIEARSRE